MVAKLPTANIKDELNRLAPAAHKVGLGNMLDDLANGFNAFLTHVDTVNGSLGNTNEATFGVKTVEQRVNPGS